ncbi:MAG: Gfo/Idh/MocA family oxidoreductase [Rhodospirillales bacterium]|nr:Gfo/Idh/MocA family oxidoreductase [Rhodospirillales bacterium]MCW8970756.1 Gfo/Idh/MocA family oxidoreductase [Rhodospirillales bacterium]
MSATAPSEPLRVLIVGCGAIAGGLDEGGAGVNAVLSHAGAYKAHPGFDVVGCVEPADGRRQAFMDAWGVRDGSAALADMEGAYDLVSVCTPTETHAEVLETILGWPIRAVFCEKPLSGDFEMSRAIADAYARTGCSLAVNFTRRWDPEMKALRRRIAAGEWGAVQAVVGTYTKGVLTNGCHMVDLLQFLIGPVRAESVHRKRDDLGRHDPTVDALLSFEDGSPVHLVGLDSRRFFSFELDLILEAGRITIEDSGFRLRERRAGPSEYFAGYRALDSGRWRTGGYGAAFPAAIDNLYRHLTEGATIESTAETALTAEAVCRDLAAMSENIPWKEGQ